MSAQICILGAGTGGTLTANRLRKEVPDAFITVVDENDRHVYQPGLLFVPFGLAHPEDIVRPPADNCTTASSTRHRESTTWTSRPSRCSSRTAR